jgi:hypothetical protein
MQSLEHVLALAGALVPLLSMAASLFNTTIRHRQLEGREISPKLAATGAVLNTLAVNLDKAASLAAAARGKPLISGTVTASKAAPR